MHTSPSLRRVKAFPAGKAFDCILHRRVIDSIEEYYFSIITIFEVVPKLKWDLVISYLPRNVVESKVISIGRFILWIKVYVYAVPPHFIEGHSEGENLNGVTMTRMLNLYAETNSLKIILELRLLPSHRLREHKRTQTRRRRNRD